MAEIFEGWLKKPLGDVAKVISGYAFKSSEFGEQGIPVIKIKNIRVGFVDLSEVDRVDRKFLSIPDRFHVQRGDVLISLTGSHITQPNSVVGRVARHAADLPRCLLNQRAGKIIVKDRSRCDPSFLFYALSEQETLHAIAMKAHGAASQANVSPSQVESIEIPFPPLPVQERIACILSAYDELIENSQRRIKILESMAHALYREWFVNFRFPGHENHPRVASPLGVIPQGWEVQKLGAVFQTVLGGTPSRAKTEYWKNGTIAWINSGKVNDLRITAGLPQLPNRHQFSSSSSFSTSTAKPRSAARNSSEVAASNRLVLMLVLTEVFSRMRFNAIWRTSARLWATWPVRARA